MPVWCQEFLRHALGPPSSRLPLQRPKRTAAPCALCPQSVWRDDSAVATEDFSRRNWEGALTRSMRCASASGMAKGGLPWSQRGMSSGRRLALRVAAHVGKLAAEVPAVHSGRHARPAKSGANQELPHVRRRTMLASLHKRLSAIAIYSIICALAAMGQTHDAADEFSATTNPSGTWRYGWSPALGGAFSVYTDSFQTAGVDFWGVTGGFPAAYKNDQALPAMPLTAVVLEPGDLAIHPGALGQWSTIRWTATQPGNTRSCFTFESIDQQQSGTVDVAVLHNGAPVFVQALTAMSATAGSVALSVAPGDTIDFSVGHGQEMQFFNDTTRLTARITYDSFMDCNSNCIPDDLDIQQATSSDVDANGIPDECSSPSLCSGDGGDQMGCTACPCGNNGPIGIEGGCLNSASSGAALSASGSTSVSLPLGDVSDLRFSLTGAPPIAFCVLNSGDAVAPANPVNPCFGQASGTQSALYDGLRCAVSNTRRHGGRASDANGHVGVTNNPWGGEAGPTEGLAIASGPFLAGQTRFFQVVHRDDPALSCMRGLNTSQAIEVTFTP